MNENAHSLREVVEHLKPVGDVISIGALLGSLVQLLPSIAAVLTIVWTAIRIYETDTVQRWLTKGKRND